MIVVRDADVTRLFAREVDDFVSPAAGNAARIQQFPILREQRGEKTVELCNYVNKCETSICQKWG